MNSSDPALSGPRAVPAYSLYGEPVSSAPALHIERITDRAPLNDWRIELHRHPSLTQFLLIERGTFKATIEAVSCLMTGPSLIGIPAGQAHAFEFQPNTRGYVLSLREFPIEIEQSRSLMMLSDSIMAPGSDEMLGTCRYLHQIQGRCGQGYRELKDALVSQIRAHVRILQDELGVGDSGSSGHRLVRQFEEEIVDRLRERWSVAQHAHALHVTPTHLNRVVKSTTGLTASQLIAHATLERAKALLLHTNRSVAEVAFSLGYDDPPHFSRRFRSWTGYSPRDWRLIDMQHRDKP